MEAGLECLNVIFCCLAVIPPFSLRLTQSQTNKKYAKRHVSCMYKPFQRVVPVMLCGLPLICPHSFLIAASHYSISVDLAFVRLSVRLFWMFERYYKSSSQMLWSLWFVSYYVSMICTHLVSRFYENSEICKLLGYYPPYNDTSLPTIRRNPSIPFSRVNKSKKKRNLDP